MPYLTVEQYVARYGAQETKLLTDEAKTGNYVSEKVEAAITTAEEEANGFIGRRYIIPLAAPPALVKGIIGSLARWYLYKNNRPQTVVDDAEVARKQLLLIGKGELTIPGADGIIEESGAGVPTYGSSGDAAAPIFSEQSLAGFDIPSSAPVANWRR